jgi:type IV secretion system protein VirB9
VGDGAIWQVAAYKSADRLFVKPTQASGDTDMTVVTDTRIYVFELVAVPSPDPSMAYIVRFHYPVAPQAPPAQAGEGTVVYRFSGAREIRPLSMTDDGRFTTIIWPDRTPFPAVSLVDDGKETLANGAVRDGRLVIDGVASQFVFREAGKTAFAERRIVKPRWP